MNVLIEIDSREHPCIKRLVEEFVALKYDEDIKVTVVVKNLKHGDIHIVDDDGRDKGELYVERKSKSDMLQSIYSGHMDDQFQRYLDVEEPFILVISGFWGEHKFSCPSCNSGDIYVVIPERKIKCPSCKKRLKIKAKKIKVKDTELLLHCNACEMDFNGKQDDVRLQDMKSIATTMAKFEKSGIPAFAVPDDYILVYFMLQYFEMGLFYIPKHRAIMGTTANVEYVARVIYQKKGMGEEASIALGKMIKCPADISKLEPIEMSNAIRKASKKPEKKKPLQKVVDFFNAWHGIVEKKEVEDNEE